MSLTPEQVRDAIGNLWQDTSSEVVPESVLSTRVVDLLKWLAERELARMEAEAATKPHPIDMSPPPGSTITILP